MKKFFMWLVIILVAVAFGAGVAYFCTWYFSEDEDEEIVDSGSRGDDNYSLSISLDKDYQIEVGDYVYVTPSLYPSYTLFSDVDWYSDNLGVCNIVPQYDNSCSCVLVGVNQGVANVYCYVSSDFSIYDKLTVSVTNSQGWITEEDGFELSYSTFFSLTQGTSKSYTLSWSGYPYYLSDYEVKPLDDKMSFSNFIVDQSYGSLSFTCLAVVMSSTGSYEPADNGYGYVDNDTTCSGSSCYVDQGSTSLALYDRYSGSFSVSYCFKSFENEIFKNSGNFIVNYTALGSATYN